MMRNTICALISDDARVECAQSFRERARNTLQKSFLCKVDEGLSVEHTELHLPVSTDEEAGGFCL